MTHHQNWKTQCVITLSMMKRIISPLKKITFRILNLGKIRQKYVYLQWLTCWYPLLQWSLLYWYNIYSNCVPVFGSCQEQIKQIFNCDKPFLWDHFGHEKIKLLMFFFTFNYAFLSLKIWVSVHAFSFIIHRRIIWVHAFFFKT